MSMFTRQDPAQLAAQLLAMKGGNDYSDANSREWKLTLDNAKNGTAVIRFLPARTPEDAPFVKVINHGFKMNGKWYIENCTSTHGDFDSCPVCKYISENDLYNTNNKLYGDLKRKTSYWTNILVIKDPACPENEGKVFKYRFGQKVMDKILSMGVVDEAMGEVAVNVFCAVGGANFMLKVKQVSGFSNYDECKFLAVAPIAGIETPEVQATITEGMQDITSLAAPDQFNTFEKNDESFKRIMGTASLGGSVAAAGAQADSIAAELDGFNAQMDSFTADAQSVTETAVQVEKPAASAADPDLDDLMAGL